MPAFVVVDRTYYLVEGHRHRGCAAGSSSVWSESQRDARRFATREEAEAFVAAEWATASDRVRSSFKVVAV